MELCRISELINKLDIENRWDRVLSIGEQQRVSICRALIYQPDLLFLDEATSALDQETEEHLYEIITKIFVDAVIISVSHKPNVKKWHNKLINI